MRFLIATAGVLSPDPVADLTSRLADDHSEVSVTTVIEVPRTFLDTIRSEEWHPLHGQPPDWHAREDEMIAQYVEERGQRLTDPLLAALRSRRVDASAVYLEGEDPAETIIKHANDIDADAVILGATKQLFDESYWESVSARVMRDAQRAVLVVPTVPGFETPTAA